MKKINQRFKDNYDYLSYVYSSQLSKSVIINNEHWKYVYTYLKNKKYINDNLLKKTAQIPPAGDGVSTPLVGDAAPTAQAGDKEK